MQLVEVNQFFKNVDKELYCIVCDVEISLEIQTQSFKPCHLADCTDQLTRPNVGDEVRGNPDDKLAHVGIVLDERAESIEAVVLEVVVPQIDF